MAHKPVQFDPAATGGVRMAGVARNGGWAEPPAEGARQSGAPGSSSVGTERSPTDSQAGAIPIRPRRHRPFLVVIFAVVAAVAMISAAYALTDGFHVKSSSGAVVLVDKGAYYSLPGGQFNAVAFGVSTTSMLNGTFTNTLGITVYTMTPDEVVALAKTGNVSSYAWSSGRIANLTVTGLDLSVGPGQWDVVFLNTNNPDPLNTTVVGFYTDLTVAPA
jgi:hypothetical protein